MIGWRRLAVPATAIAALAFLGGMVLSGSQPVLRQNVKFEAKGLLDRLPEQIRRVELGRGTERLTAVRTGEKRWAMPDGTDLGEEAGKRLSMAVQMMHTSAPANEISAAELPGADVAAFELDPPRLVARLYVDGPTPVLAAQFGAYNPDGFRLVLEMLPMALLILWAGSVGAHTGGTTGFARLTVEGQTVRYSLTLDLETAAKARNGPAGTTPSPLAGGYDALPASCRATSRSRPTAAPASRCPTPCSRPRRGGPLS